jgi:hypothetical protein
MYDMSFNMTPENATTRFGALNGASTNNPHSTSANLAGKNYLNQALIRVNILGLHYRAAAG